MESEWTPQMMQLLDIDAESLPIIWDADFLYGPRTASGEDTYVLCEINVSSVFPFPRTGTLGDSRASPWSACCRQRRGAARRTLDAVGRWAPTTKPRYEVLIQGGIRINLHRME